MILAAQLPLSWTSMLKRLTIMFLFAGLVPSLPAQMRGGFGGGGFHGGFYNGGGFGANRGGRFGRYPAFWGDPYFYADYPYPSLASAPQAAPVVVVQSASAAATQPDRPSESVLIEWQGDRYVRSTGEHEASLQDYADTGAVARSDSSAQSRPVSHSELAPAVLVFRDGHREQVLDYVIARGNLYARGDYYRDGYWTRDIQLASLDIAATLKANEQSGVKFVLPSSPNEVVTRP
jgi:hypothetical protein